MVSKGNLPCPNAFAWHGVQFAEWLCGRFLRPQDCSLSFELNLIFIFPATTAGTLSAICSVQPSNVLALIKGTMDNTPTMTRPNSTHKFLLAMDAFLGTLFGELP